MYIEGEIPVIDFLIGGKRRVVLFGSAV